MPEKRNQDVAKKPQVARWFTLHPSAWSHFELALKTLRKHYRGTNEGYIDRASNPEYRFGGRGAGVWIIGRNKHATVRARMVRGDVPSKFRDHCNVLNDRWGEPYEVVDFVVVDKPSAQALSSFLEKANIEDFGPARRAKSIPATGEHVDQLNAFRTKFEKQVARAMKSDRTARLRRLQRRDGQSPKFVWVSTRTVERDPDVVAEVLFLSKGKCYFCHKKAPFKRSIEGTPYLEVHHLKPLADNGPDTVENAVAVCPNCHRKVHDQLRSRRKR